jgi:hypothetical protein
MITGALLCGFLIGGMFVVGVYGVMGAFNAAD